MFINFLRKEFPEIVFLNPACDVAEKVAKNLKITSRKNKITIFTTGNPKNFQNNLIRIGIKNKVNYFSL